MKSLWAPWRVQYILGEKGPGCVLCDAPAASDDRARLVLHRGGLGFVILNRYPYNSGHLMAVPYRHVGRLEELTREESAEIMALAGLCVRALTTAMAPDGYNIGMNLGGAAGAGIDDHLHIHIVPRWRGDTNFMPVLGDVKVLPEHLESTYDRLAAAFLTLGSNAEG